MPRRKKQPKEPKEVKTTIRGKKNVVQTVVVKVGDTKRRGRRRRSAPKPDVMMRELPPPVIYQTGPAQIPAPLPAPPAPPAPNVPPAFAAEAQAQQLLNVGLAGTHDILRRQIESLRGGQPNEIVEPVMEGVSRDIPFVPLVEERPPPRRERYNEGMKQLAETGKAAEERFNMSMEDTASHRNRGIEDLIKTEKSMEERFNMGLEDFDVPAKKFRIKVPLAPVEFPQQPVSGHLSLVEPNIHNNVIARGEDIPPTPKTPKPKTPKPKTQKGKFSEPADLTPYIPVIPGYENYTEEQKARIKLAKQKQAYVEARMADGLSRKKATEEWDAKTVNPDVIDINTPLGRSIQAAHKPGEIYNPIPREPQSNLFVAPREEEKKQQEEVMQQTGLPF